ncbi:Uncharacterised protein [Starkeya nomas]|uniref:DUF4440 domain-containing protein n=1 Tax=Starkeya nomas TaxID=2666134 RepID=A0A5S9PEK2_9HYPH|nr:nuclear transport factor 2 family protein [Starkeya nomas]CAA0102073.1 Uncharacterised protein [Starkeya nomas]
MSEAASAAEDPAGDLAGVEAAERRLRDAALHGDVATLDALLADDLIFVDQTGRFLSKADDLELHRSGALTLDTLRFSDYRLRALVLAVLRADATGRAAGEAFTVALRFSRLWRREPTGWRVASAHSTAIS